MLKRVKVMTVKSIFDFLNSRFPMTDAMDFDYVGILIGDPEKEVKKALVCLDCTLEAIDYAKEKQCDLIITHHPVIFSPLKKILRGSLQYELIANNLSVISMHTNLDIGMDGVNDSLCEVLGIEDTENITAYDGYTVKLGTISPTDPCDLARHIKSKIGGCVKFTEGKSPISKVLVCGGSGGNYIEDAVRLGVDALITADVKHHHFLIAYDNGISLYDAGHFNTEDVVKEPLKELLAKEFKNTEFFTFHSKAIKFE